MIIQFFVLFLILINYDITATKKAIHKDLLKHNQVVFGFMEDVDSRHHHHHQHLTTKNIKKNEKVKKRKKFNQESSVKRDSLTNLPNKKLHLPIINTTLSKTLLHNSTFSTNALHTKFRNIFHNKTLHITNKTTNTSSSRPHMNLTLESPKDTSGDKRHHYYHPVHRYHPHFLHDDDDEDEDEEDDREFFKHHILPVEPITDTIDPIQRMGHVEPIDPIDPMEPIDPIEPIERIREIEPVEPMEKIERMESLFPMKSIEEEDGEAKSKIPKRHNHTKRYNYSKIPSRYKNSNHRRYLSKHNLTNLYYNLASHVVEVPIEHNPNDELKVTNDRVFMLPSGTTLVNLDDGHQNWHSILGARGSLGVLHPATGATGAVYSAKGAGESRVGVHEPASGVTKPAVGVTDPAKGSMKEAVKATGAGPDSKTEAGKKLPPNEGYKKDELTDCNKVDNSRVKNCTNETDINEESTSQLLPPAGLDSVASLNNMIERLKNESNNFQDSQKYTESVVKLIHNLTKAFNNTNKEKLERQRNLTRINKHKLNERAVNSLMNKTKAIAPENKQCNKTITHNNSTVSSRGKFNTTQIEHYHQLKMSKNEKDSIDSKQLQFELVEDVDTKYQNNNSTVKTNQILPEERLFHSDSIDSTLHEYELVGDQIYDHRSKANKTLLSDVLKGRYIPVFRDSIDSKSLEYELVENQNTNNVSSPKLKQTLLRNDLKGRFLQHHQHLNVSNSQQQLTGHNHIMSLNDTDKLNATDELLPKVNNSIHDRQNTNTVVMLDGRSNSSKLGKDDSEKQFQQNNNKQIKINETKGIFSSSEMMLKKSPSSISIGDRRGIVIPKFPNPPISSRIEEFKDPEPIKPIKMKEIPIPIKDFEIKESLDKSPDIEPIDLGQLTTRLMDEPIKSIELIESKIPDIKKNPVIEPIPPIEVM